MLMKTHKSVQALKSLTFSMSYIHHLTLRRNLAKSGRMQVIVPTHAYLHIKTKGQWVGRHAQTRTHKCTHAHTHVQTEQVNYFINNINYLLRNIPIRELKKCIIWSIAGMRAFALSKPCFHF